MNINVKKNIANIAITTIIFTIIIIVFWFIAFILMNTFDLKVFASKTTEFFYLFIFAAFAIVACATFLTLSLNMSIIADSKILEINKLQSTDNNKKSNIKKFGIIIISIIVLFILFLFIADNLSRNRFKKNLISECDDILDRYKFSINKISHYLLVDKKNIKKIPSMLDFLANQKAEFPNIILITSDIYDNQLTFLKITEHTSTNNIKQEYFNNSFYKCNKEDCDYLKKVFKEKYDKQFFWTKKADYHLYKPIKYKNKIFILLFSKYKRYGKFGS